MPIEFFSRLADWINKKGVKSDALPLRTSAHSPLEVIIPSSHKDSHLNFNNAAFLQSIFRSAPIGIGLVTPQRKMMWVNDRFCDMLGYSVEELVGQGARILYASDEEFLRVGKEKYEQISKVGIGAVETKFLTKSGRVIDVYLSSSPLDPNDRSKGTTFTALNITDWKNAERALRVERDLGLELSLAGSMQDVIRLCCEAVMKVTDLDCGGIYLVDGKTGGLDLVYHTGVSSAFIRMASKYGPDAANTQLVMKGDPIYVDYQTLCKDILKPSVQTDGIRAFAVIPIKYQGKVIGCFNLGSHAVDEIPQFARQILETTASYIGEAIMVKQFENRLHYQAHYDALTELPNRLLAYDRLNQAIRVAHWSQHMVGVLFVDLDQFKLINETMGHASGDVLLIQVAKRLQSCLKDNMSLARFGGDEFLVLLPGIMDAIEADIVAKKIRDAFIDPFHLAAQEVFMTPTIGISIYPSDGADPDTLLKNADTALHKAKAESRNAVRFFTQEFNEKARRRMELETLLRHAIEKRELFLNYQPVIDLKTGKLWGVEALLRWKSEKLGLVMPDRFISLAEDTGLIVPLGEWVLEEACHQGVKLQKDLGFPVNMSVNMSPRQVKSLGFLSTLKRTFDFTGFPPASLSLEITENLLMDALPTTHEILRQIGVMNVNLSVDDFGTGYSALGYLTKYNFQMVKIDRSFVSDLVHGNKNMALVQGIISLSHSLGMVVVGEGVETVEQLKILKDNGCDMAQGFFISHPVMPVDLNAFDWSARQPILNN